VAGLISIEGAKRGRVYTKNRTPSVEELLARIRSLLRRHGNKATVFEPRGIKMDLLARTVTRNNQKIDLTAWEFSP
jgi:DNA-binding response OmpR family regulator